MKTLSALARARASVVQGACATSTRTNVHACIRVRVAPNYIIIMQHDHMIARAVRALVLSTDLTPERGKGSGD